MQRFDQSAKQLTFGHATISYEQYRDCLMFFGYNVIKVNVRVYSQTDGQTDNDTSFIYQNW